MKCSICDCLRVISVGCLSFHGKWIRTSGTHISMSERRQLRQRYYIWSARERHLLLCTRVYWTVVWTRSDRTYPHVHCLCTALFCTKKTFLRLFLTLNWRMLIYNLHIVIIIKLALCSWITCTVLILYTNKCRSWVTAPVKWPQRLANSGYIYAIINRRPDIVVCSKLGTWFDSENGSV